MVEGTMMMIPGEWESRPRSVAAVEPLPAPPRQPADSPGGNAPQPVARRGELPGWLRVSIFAATLLAATWLVMLLEATSR